MSIDTPTAYCYHCRLHHPITEMRQVLQKHGKRWRCIRSIEATKVSQEKREAYGRTITEQNKSEAAAKAKTFNALRERGP